jgi:hypothetical protein
LREWCQDMLAARHPVAGIGDGVPAFWNEVMTNQDLRNRSLQQAQELGDALAQTLAHAIPDDRWHAEAAAQLLGATIGTVFTTAIKKQLSGVPVEQVRTEQIDVIDAAFDLLDRGLATYGT